MDVRVGEGREDAAAAEVDAVRCRQRALVGADAADDPVARDREGRGGRQRRVHRPDDAVRDDHARSLDAPFRSRSFGARCERRARYDRTLRSEGRLGVRESACAPLARGAPARRGRLSCSRGAVGPGTQSATRTSTCFGEWRPGSRRPRARRRRARPRRARAPVPRRRAAADQPVAPVENATVVLVLDTSRSMLSRGRRPHAARGREAGGAGVPRPRPRPAPRRARHVRRAT